MLCRALGEGLAAKCEVVLVSPDHDDDLRAEWWVHEHIHWPAGTFSRGSARELADELARRGVEVGFFHGGGVFAWGSRAPGKSPIIFAARRGIRVFSVAHSVTTSLEGYCGPDKALWFKLALFPFAWLAKLQLLAHVEREITVSQHDCAALQKRYWPLARKFVQVYHSRLSATRELKARAEEPLIVNVGHLAERKGQLDLLQAFALIAEEFPEWKLAFVGYFGDDNFRNRFMRAIGETGLNERVILAGPQPDPTPWLLRASLYVQPSREEAFGLALQEAMFAGCACIGTRVGGIPELLEPGTGILTPANSINALADAIRVLITNPHRRAELGASAAQSIRRRGMTREEMVGNYLKICGEH